MTKKAWLFGALVLSIGVASAQVTQKKDAPDPKKTPAKSAPSPLWKSAVAPKPIKVFECDVTAPGNNCGVTVTVTEGCVPKANPPVVKIRGKLSNPPSKLVWRVAGGWQFHATQGIEFKTPDGQKVFTGCARSPAPNLDEYSCDNSHVQGYYEYNIKVVKGDRTCSVDPGAWNTPVP